MKWTWDKFGIYVTQHAADPVVTDRAVYGTPNRDMILELLGLSDDIEVSVEFFKAVGRAAVAIDIIQHPINPEVNYRANRQSGWDIDVYSPSSLRQVKVNATCDFQTVDGVDELLARALVTNGYFTFDDLSVIEPCVLAKLGSLEARVVDEIIEQAEIRADETER